MGSEMCIRDRWWTSRCSSFRRFRRLEPTAALLRPRYKIMAIRLSVRPYVANLSGLFLTRSPPSRRPSHKYPFVTFKTQFRHVVVKGPPYVLSMVAQALSPILASGVNLELAALGIVAACYAAFEIALWISRRMADAPGSAAPVSAVAPGAASRSSISATNRSFVSFAQIDVDAYGRDD